MGHTAHARKQINSREKKKHKRIYEYEMESAERMSVDASEKGGRGKSDYMIWIQALLRGCMSCAW